MSTLADRRPRDKAAGAHMPFRRLGSDPAAAGGRAAVADPAGEAAAPPIVGLTGSAATGVALVGAEVAEVAAPASGTGTGGLTKSG